MKDDNRIEETLSKTQLDEIVGIRPTKSFEDDLNLYFIRDLKNEANHLVPNFDKSKLGSLRSSLDSGTIEELNEDSSLEKIILAFNSQNPDKIQGSVDTKRIAITIINKLKSFTYRDTDEGARVYEAYASFRSKLNVDFLSHHNLIDYDKDLIENSVFYCILCYDPDIATINDFCKSMNTLFNSTDVTIPSNNIIDTSSMDRDLENQKGELDTFKKDSNKAIDKVAESRQGAMVKCYRVLVSFWKATPYIMAGTTVSVTLGLGIFAWSNRSLLPPVPSFTTTTNLPLSLPSTKTETPTEESGSIAAAIAKLINAIREHHFPTK